MSRHTIPALLEGFEVTVGWDRPMNTYFAQVENLNVPDEDEPIVVWIGAAPSEIQTPEALQPHIAQYAIIPADILQELRADREATLDRGNTQLQRVLKRFEGRGEKDKS